MTNIDLKRLAEDREYWDQLGAPEDATHYTPETRNNRACWWINFSDQRDKALCLLADSNHDSWSMEDADEDERGVVIPRPQASEAEWVDGLPPIGAVCEGMINYGSSTKWRTCEVLKHRKGQAAVLVDDPGFLAWCEQFRPIRTKEQRLRDELSETVRKAYLDGALNHAGGLAAIVDKLISEGWTKEPKP